MMYIYPVRCIPGMGACLFYEIPLNSVAVLAVQKLWHFYEACHLSVIGVNFWAKGIIQKVLSYTYILHFLLALVVFMIHIEVFDTFVFKF